MQSLSLFGIPIPSLSSEKILYKIIKDVSLLQFYHVVSLNPEILVETLKNKNFKKVVTAAHLRIVDGIGVVLAIQALYGIKVERTSGVDLFQKLMEIAGKNSLRVVLIGGKPKLADNIAVCYQQKFKNSVFLGLQGVSNIKNPSITEMKKIESIVADIRPHFVFVAFGSPFQEQWIWNNRKLFSQSICMGVGQGFDVLGNRIRRAPVMVRRLGLEWLYRLVTQPWRWKRQLNLLVFVYYVIKEFIYGRTFQKKD